jgi:tRNA dimethylallyltransferase
MGPTASGKTPLAEALAEEFEAQLINADAFQVYRGLDIGTAKPEAKNRYELLDIKDPIEGFGVGEFVELAGKLLQRLWRESRSAIVVGGTGLYIRALMEEYGEMAPPPDPELRRELVELQETGGVDALARRLRAADPAAAEKVDLRNPARVRRALERALDPRPPIRLEIPPFQKVKLGLMPNAEILGARIDSRVERMVQNGWTAEVRRLMEFGVPFEAPGLQAIGYRALYRHLGGHLLLEDALEAIRAETKQYAKRQRTWLRREPGLKILDGGAMAKDAKDKALRTIAGADWRE